VDWLFEGILVAGEVEEVWATFEVFQTKVVYLVPMRWTVVVVTCRVSSVLATFGRWWWIFHRLYHGTFWAIRLRYLQLEDFFYSSRRGPWWF
jgi:hypothetical protein